ncbi:MAG: thioesterase domain-containing protein, partial [Verrucomicrobiota bacterium]
LDPDKRERPSLSTRREIAPPVDPGNELERIVTRPEPDIVSTPPAPPRNLADTTVLLQPEGTETALFGIHGGDGGVFFYRDLAARLNTNRPFYAFEAADLTSGATIRQESVEETAARYITELRKVQLEGPYFLCGYSFGGIVAFEMACQLQKAGTEIGFLGIIDANNPASEIRQRCIPERVALNWKGSDSDRSNVLQKVARLGNRFRSGLGHRVKADTQWLAAKTLPASKNTGWLRLAQVRRANTIAQERYNNPPVFEGDITLFRAMEGNDKYDWGETFGWEENVTGKIRTYDVPGNHITVFDEKNIDHISQALNEALEINPSVS